MPPWPLSPPVVTSYGALQMANQLGTVFGKLDCPPRWRERLSELAIPALAAPSASQHDALPPGQVLRIAPPVGRGSGDGVGPCRERRAQPGVKEQLDLVDCGVLHDMAEHLVVHVLKPGHWIFRKPLARNTVANKLTESHARPITPRLQSRSYDDRR
jgi:hypothetical protein